MRWPPLRHNHCWMPEASKEVIIFQEQWLCIESCHLIFLHPEVGVSKSVRWFQYCNWCLMFAPSNVFLSWIDCMLNEWGGGGEGEGRGCICIRAKWFSISSFLRSEVLKSSKDWNFLIRKLKRPKSCLVLQFKGKMHSIIVIWETVKSKNNIFVHRHDF